jgi:hypothetical protein
MLPFPNLDDRSFEEIFEQARSLIPKYCPEWTDYNESDPGITLIQLFAWMTEIILYRLNQVPEKNYLSFLELVGVSLRSPEPAKTVLTFQLKEDTKEGFVLPRGSQVESTETEEKGAVLFETEEDLLLSPVSLRKILSVGYDEKTESILVKDNTESKDKPFDIFAGLDRIRRYLYLGDRRLGLLLKKGASLRVSFRIQDLRHFKLFKNIGWEYWNGEAWIEAQRNHLEGKSSEILIDFYNLIGIKEKIVKKETESNYWIRGEIEDGYFEEDIVIFDLKAKLKIVQIKPDDAFAYIPRLGLYLPLKVEGEFTPFGDEPEPGVIFYLGSKYLTAAKGRTVSLQIDLSKPYPTPSPDLTIVWECLTQEGWKEVEELKDETGTFTASGEVSFVVPSDITLDKVNEVENYWLRARIEKGNYGRPTHFDYKKKEMVESTIKPPFFKSIGINFDQAEDFIENCLSFSNLSFRDLSKPNKKGERFILFEKEAENFPALYLGFDKSFSDFQREKLPFGIYFSLVESAVSLRGRSDEPDFSEVLSSFQEEKEERLSWEFWDGEEWKRLEIRKDETDSFSRSGFVYFTPSANLKALKLSLNEMAGEELYWIRIRWIGGSFEALPKIHNIRLNSVRVKNSISLPDYEYIGSSNEEPDQKFLLSKSPVYLEKNAEGKVLNFILEVEEKETPKARKDSPNWIRWEMVDDFYLSAKDSRHFVLDSGKGEVKFGNGIRGMIPPKGENNIRVRYCYCNGEAGNVGSHTITQLHQPESFPGFKAVTNLDPAEGGRGMETIEELKTRGLRKLKHWHRAVTKEDFELLAQEASQNVHRAKCLPSERPGKVDIIIVPKELSQFESEKKVSPTPALLWKIRDYLDRRRLITTRLEVRGPRYEPLSIKIILRLKRGANLGEVKEEVEDLIRDYLHPIRGGEDGKGWPWGRDVHLFEIAHKARECPKVAYVEEVVFIDRKGERIEKLSLQEDQLVQLIKVEVAEG